MESNQMEGQRRMVGKEKGGRIWGAWTVLPGKTKATTTWLWHLTVMAERTSSWMGTSAEEEERGGGQGIGTRGRPLSRPLQKTLSLSLHQ